MKVLLVSSAVRASSSLFPRRRRVALPTQPSEGLKPPTGVHLRRPSLVEYLLLQHWFWHSVLVEQSSQSPLREVGLGGGGVGGRGVGGVAVSESAGTTMFWATSVAQVMPAVKPAALFLDKSMVSSFWRSHPDAWTSPLLLTLVTVKVAPFAQKNNLQSRELSDELYPTQTLRPQASAPASTFWESFFLIGQVASNQQSAKQGSETYICMVILQSTMPQSDR